MFQDLGTDTESYKKMEDSQNVSEKDEEQCISQLHLAAERGDTETVRSLLMPSANVDVRDSKHNAPLHYATLNGHVDIVNLLLSTGASVNSKNALGQTSLHLVAEIGHLAIAQLLLDSNADIHATDHCMNMPIHIAAMHGHHEFVQLLLRYYRPSEVSPVLSDNASLHHAARSGHTNVAQLVLIHNQTADARNLNGDTALHLASQNGHLEVVKVLLRNNAYRPTNIRNESYMTPYHIAANRPTECAAISTPLIEHKGEGNAIDKNSDTALHFAVTDGHFTGAKAVLHQHAKMEALAFLKLFANKFADEHRPLQLPFRSTADGGHSTDQIAADSGILEVANRQLSHSSTVNAFSTGQETPNHLAAKSGQTEIGKNLMLCSTKYVNAYNKAKMTALHLACKSGHISIVEILLDNHVIVDVGKQYEETPFSFAAKNGHAEITDLLLSRGICDFVLTNRKQTPLHVAVIERHTKVVEVILKHSKLINYGNTLQENAKSAMETSETTNIQLFKSHSRRVSVGVVWIEERTPLEMWEDSDGHTALDLAVRSLQPNLVQILLKVDHCTYSEEHLGRCFDGLMQAAFEPRTRLSNIKETAKGGSDEQWEINDEDVKEIAQTLITSSPFNVNHHILCRHIPLHKVMTMEWFNSDSTKKRCLGYALMLLLLEKGTDFNIKDSFSRTPLMMASEKDCCHAIQILFDWEQKSGIKLDIDSRDRFGRTALMLAAERYHVLAVQMLLDHGASVNVQDYNGFTALHTAIYEPDSDWFDLHFLCKGFLDRKLDGIDSHEISGRNNLTWREETVETCTVIDRLKNYLALKKRTIGYKEEIVKLLLTNDEANVNAIDFMGNTTLDLAVKSLGGISSAISEGLKNRGAIRNLQEPEDLVPIEMAKVDNRGRNPLHRLIISTISDLTYAEDSSFRTPRLSLPEEKKQKHERTDLMVFGILLEPQNFIESATATDCQGRTPLHYAVIHVASKQQKYDTCRDLVDMLLKLDSKINAADMYGKTPLHYAELDDRYKLLVHHGANENATDNFGHTPIELKKLRDSVGIKDEIARNLPIGHKTLHATSIDIASAFQVNHVTELSKQKLVDTIRIYGQSPRPQESSEEAIWKIWIQNDFFRLNRRLSQLKKSMQLFCERLADGIKNKDWRFECEPILVGSAEEESKMALSADFDFNFRLIRFSRICEPFRHPLGLIGFCQLRRKKSHGHTESWSNESFDSFFNLDHCLLTFEVNYRFRNILEEVLSDPSFWQDESLFEWHVKDQCKRRPQYYYPRGFCNTVRLVMIHPVDDGEGGVLFTNISIDIVACVHVKDWWPDEHLPVGIRPDGCTFIFDRPRFDLSMPHGTRFICSETFARISFAPLESHTIKQSPPLIRAAYIVCKIILNFADGTTYLLKNSLLFCMEALGARDEREKRNQLTPKQLAFWVERTMFCFMEFNRLRVYPLYFMPSFRRQVRQLGPGSIYWRRNINEKVFMDLIPFNYCKSYDLYLDLCPDDIEIDIPVIRNRHRPMDRSLDPNADPFREEFDREEFIRRISSRIAPTD